MLSKAENNSMEANETRHKMVWVTLTSEENWERAQRQEVLFTFTL